MQITPTITFRRIGRSPALEAEILTKLRRLETFYPRITGCRILVELPQRHHVAGNRVHVRIDLTVPGEEIAVSHDASLHAVAQDLGTQALRKAVESDPARKHARVAIREAFDIARRRLQECARRQRGDIKTRVTQSRGCVSRLFPIDEYGYIEAEDGREIYFQKSSVLGHALDRLNEGSAVSFAEKPGERGPRASTVKLLHRHRAGRHTARGLSASM